MATGGVPLITDSKPAGADLSTKQFYFVKLSSDTVILCAAATDKPIGVLQNKPIAGRQAEYVVLGPSQVAVDAALSEGDPIGTSADGQADAKVYGTDTTEYVCGLVRAATGGAGTFADAYINCVNPPRAT